MEVASRPATTLRPVTRIGSTAPRLDHGLGLLGLVATIAGIGWGVYSHWQMAQAFARSGVLWGPFQDFAELVRNDPRCSPANPLFADVEQPGIGRYPMPGLPLEFSAMPREATRAAPRLGEHTDQVLSEVLGLPDREIARLHDAGIAAGPDGR